MTGFGRVMVCRFNENWQGELIAESFEPGMDAYLDLQLPAPDILVPAGDIFPLNSLRMIPDVDYIPARVYPNQHPHTGDVLDLGKATLRSVSAVHLECLRSRWIKASMTLSLAHQDMLWGVIACYHASPLLIKGDVRFALKQIGHLISAQLVIQEDLEARERKL